MKTQLWTSLLALTVITIAIPNRAQAVIIPTVAIGVPGNTADSNGFGSVSYAFQMGKYEVTNTEYVAFLNAVAATDTYGLFKTSPGEPLTYGINRSGSSGSYTYSVKPAGNSGTYDYTNRPVAWVSVGDAMRFANWLHNGQPTGAQNSSTTEDGAYTLNGKTSAADLKSVTRNAGAKWWLPNENEWYKAAYYDPSTSTYFDYPTSSNSVPSNVAPPGTNSANFSNPQGSGASGVGTTYPHTIVGAYTSAASPYGTFDQGGNVWEWSETLYSNTSDRVGRGGSWYHTSSTLNKANSINLGSEPTYEYSSVGIRVATVPEPSSVVLLGLGLLGLGAWRRRRRRMNAEG